MARPTFNRTFIKFLRSPYWPASASALVAPGLGQIINRDFAKGLFLLFASLGSLFYFSRVITSRLDLILPGGPEQWTQNEEGLRTAVMRLVNETPGFFITFHLLLMTVYIFGIADAYISAKKRKRNRPSIRHENINN